MTCNGKTIYIDKITNKSSKGIGMIKKIKHKLRKETLITHYYTFVYPYLSYCNMIWGKAAKTHLSKIHLLQKRVVRMLCNVGYRNSTQILFKDANIMSIYEQSIFFSCVFILKFRKGLPPLIFNHLFTARLCDFCPVLPKMYGI